MALDLGTITSAVILRDVFSEILDHVIEGIHEFEHAAAHAFPEAAQFAEDLAPAFKAAAASIAVTVGAIAALDAATFELAKEGAHIEDLEHTLEHFSGGAQLAKENLDAMKEGMRGTVDDMKIMKEETRLLSANVHLNADEFKTLGEAAFVMQNRGLGSTAEMMDAISNAMITGRTRGLAMKLGVIDLGDAAANYAKTLGVEASMLSMTGKAEATRIQIMQMLTSAVKDAGQQHLDFGEKVDQALAAFSNWNDELAKAVTDSPVLTAMVNSLGDAFGTAFENKDELIKSIVHWLEQALIFTVDLGIGTVEATRVLYTAWKGVETAVLFVTTGIVGLGSSVASAQATIAEFAASLPLATQGMKDLAAEYQDKADVYAAFTQSLKDQTAESANAVMGQSEFQQTLDKVGGALFAMRDRMLEASKATHDGAVITHEKANAERDAKEATDKHAQSMIDQAQAAKLQAKGLSEATKLLGELHVLQLERSGDVTGKQIADIENWRRALTDKMKEAHTDTKAFYEALEALSKEKMRMVGIDWDSVKDKSIEALRAQAAVARATYSEMQVGSLHFSREVLEEQRKKVQDLEDAARGMGAAYKKAFNEAADAAKRAADETKRIKDEAEAARKANLAMGGSFEITRENFAASARGLGGNEQLVENLLKKGYSFQQALLWSKHPDWAPPENPGPRVPGFAMGVDNWSGGPAWVGERGPEVLDLPRGSSITPVSHIGGFTLNFYGNYATGRDIVRQVKEAIMSDAMLSRLLPSR